MRHLVLKVLHRVGYLQALKIQGLRGEQKCQSRYSLAYRLGSVKWTDTYAPCIHERLRPPLYIILLPHSSLSTSLFSKTSLQPDNEEERAHERLWGQHQGSQPWLRYRGQSDRD